MGNDGGSIPTRRELVKEAARDQTTTEVKALQQEQQGYDWTTCPLSHRPLAPPVVSDQAGKLYNKDAVLQFLLPPAAASSPHEGGGPSRADAERFLAGRVRSWKDVVEVKFEEEEAVAADADEDEDRRRRPPQQQQQQQPQQQRSHGGGRARTPPRWVCPVTKKVLGPKVKSVYLVPCGHAFSESAIREIAADHCLQLTARFRADDQCNEPFTAENVIRILAIAPADLHRLEARAQMLQAQGLTHSLKKASGGKKQKKRKNAETEAGRLLQADASTLDGEDPTRVETQTAHESRGTPTPTTTTTTVIKDAATASLTAKVLQHEKERQKRRKLAMNENLKSLFSSSGAAPDAGSARNAGDFMTRGYSIPANAKR
ncbi:MAG: hypothetical protein M1826_004605 [Phylliscum demangeonii]|nr:MAG: hypothetical protein M1826_004605 [Phylliscum demangeonii]